MTWHDVHLAQTPSAWTIKLKNGAAAGEPR
jgi:hypothetical protein